MDTDVTWCNSYIYSRKIIIILLFDLHNVDTEKRDEINRSKQRRRKAWVTWATAHGLAEQRASRLTNEIKFKSMEIPKVHDTRFFL